MCERDSVTYWITDYLGTQSKNEPYPINVWIDHLLDLNDGWNPPQRIYLRAKYLLNLLFNGEKVVLVCEAGINRSNGMTTLLLAYMKNISWDEAYVFVRKKVKRAYVNPGFRDCCIEALEKLRSLTQECPNCSSPIEDWETSCARCWEEGRKRIR